MKVIIDIPKGLYYSVIDGHSDDCVKSLVDTFKNATLLDNVTNGDIIKAMFPNVPVLIFEDMDTVLFGNAQFDLNWWDEPYKGAQNE